MTLPAGEPTRSQLGAVNCGTECEPDPTHLADAAEDAARRAVEGVGITVTVNPDRKRHPKDAGAGLSYGRCARPGT